MNLTLVVVVVGFLIKFNSDRKIDNSTINISQSSENLEKKIRLYEYTADNEIGDVSLVNEESEKIKMDEAQSSIERLRLDDSQENPPGESTISNRNSSGDNSNGSVSDSQRDIQRESGHENDFSSESDVDESGSNSSSESDRDTYDYESVQNETCLGEWLDALSDALTNKMRRCIVSLIYNRAQALIADKECGINKAYKGLPLLVKGESYANQFRNDIDSRLFFSNLTIAMLKRSDIDINATVPYTNYSAMHVACRDARDNGDITAALLERDDCDLGLQDWQGYTPLHTFLYNIKYDDVYPRSIALLRKFMEHPRIEQSLMKVNNDNQSVMDMFLMNSYIHSYDLEFKLEFWMMLKILLRVPVMLRVSGGTLATAARFACPSVFDKLLQGGARVNDALSNNETTLHIAIYRNSVAKLKSILDKNNPDEKVDLSQKWNFLTAEQMARRYGCTKYIVDRLAGIQEVESSNKQMVEQRLSTDLKLIKRITSTTIKILKNYEELNYDLVIVVKNNQILMTEYRSEIEKMKSCLETFLSEMCHDFANSTSGRTHLVFKSLLSGSMADGTRCYLPNEYDYTCYFTHTTDIQFNKREVTSSRESAWGDCRWFENRDELGMREVAQQFYAGCAAFCHEYNSTCTHNETGIAQCLFQYMDKISRLRLQWKGGFFNGLFIEVDLVPAFCNKDDVSTLPLGLSTDKLLIAKTSRFLNADDATYFPCSYVVPESEIVQSLPTPMREGLIIAKSIRLASICSPAVNMNALGIVEDLQIEDYVTSHILKNCVLLLLHCLFFLGDEEKKNIKSVMCEINNCKYLWAELIYHILECSLNDKILRSWHLDEQGELFNCTACKEEWVCCQKRKIKLVLVKQIRRWLRINIFGLHGGGSCDCEYEGQDTESVQRYLARLLSTGMIKDNAQQFNYEDWQKEYMQIVSDFLAEYFTDEDEDTVLEIL